MRREVTVLCVMGAVLATVADDRTALEAKVKEVADLRREVQYAADLLWPADKKTHAGIRKAFGLPVNKALR